MSKHLHIFLLVLLLLALAPDFPTISQEKVDQSEQNNAKKVWDQLIQKKGGREKLHGLQSFVYSRSDNGGWTRLHVFPNKVWEFADFPETGRITRIYDSDARMSFSLDLFQITSKYPIGADYVKDAFGAGMLQSLLLETKWLSPTPIRVRYEKGKNITVIETLLENERIDFVFPTDTFLVSEIRAYGYQDGRRPGKEKFSDYVDVDGIQMPTKLDSTFDEKKGTVTMKFAFDVKYVPDLFTNPMPAYGPEDWRKRPQHNPL